MKTLFQINTTSNYGSTGHIAENIGLLAMRQGWNCYIAHGSRYTNPTQLKDICMGTNWSEKLHGLRSLCLDEHGLGSKRATLKLVDKIEKMAPDIIHLHNIHGYYLNYPILFAYLAETGATVVWTLHDCWCMTGHCVYFDYVHCDKWMTHCAHCPQLKTYPKSLFWDNSYYNYELKRRYFLKIKDQLHLVPVSDWLAALLKQSFLKDCEVTRIHNGIDINQFSPIARSNDTLLDKNKFWILGVASPWVQRKGYDNFIRLRSLLSDDFGIVMIGLSKKQIRNLPKGILGLERTNSVHQLAELYSQAGVFFNPTWEDNFPTTNLEALACGTPVITYRTGGSPEAISESTGFVIEQGDLERAIAAFQTIRAKGKESYTSSCRSRAINQFDKNKSFQQYLDLYDQILGCAK